MSLAAVQHRSMRRISSRIDSTIDGLQTPMAATAATGINGIAISMDGKGCWRDNVFVERLWKSIKYEEVYLRAYDSVSHAKQSIGRYLTFYNTRRPHSSLARKTLDQVYFNPPLPMPKAARHRRESTYRIGLRCTDKRGQLFGSAAEPR
jgi:putative transposase